LSPLVLDYSSADISLEAAGGKGANLAKLWRAGFPVPPGFIVATQAYRGFVQANGLQDRIVALASAAAPDDPVSLDGASEGIRSLFAVGVMPDAVAAEIAASYERLSAGAALPVAVRSSATAEDLPGMSFAGQQDTYLNVIGAAAVLAAVRDCWASLWTARALGYRARNGIAPAEVSLAVVVQALVPAEAAGVLFTANPVTGRRDEMVIDASLGLGEAVVSGQVEPDHYVVRRASGAEGTAAAWSVAERRLGAKAMVTLPAEGGGIRHVESRAADRQALADEQIVALAGLSERVAALMGSPQDIEWAWAGTSTGADGKLHLLQSRPITTLYPLADPAYHGGDLRVYFSFNSVQGLADPLTPVGLDFIALVIGGTLTSFGAGAGARTAVTRPGGRLYVDITALAADPTLRRVLMVVLRRGDPVAKNVIARLLADGRIAERKTALPSGAPRGRMVLRFLRAALMPDHARRVVLQQAEAYEVAVSGKVGPFSTLAEVVGALEEVMPSSLAYVLMRLGPVIIVGVGMMTLVDRLLVRWLGEEAGAVFALTRGIPGNVTTEMDLKLWAASRAIAADGPSRSVVTGSTTGELAAAWRRGELPAAAQAELDGFLRAYGMRGAGEIDLGRLRWADDPAPILQTIRNYLEVDDVDRAPDAAFARGALASSALLAEYQDKLHRKPLGFIRAHILGEAVRRMRLLTAVRESPKFAMIRIWYPYHQALLRHGDALRVRGLLDRSDDIFFLPLETLKRLGAARGDEMAALEGSLRATALAARDEYAHEAARPRAPRILLSTGEAIYDAPAEPAGPGELTGDPVSPGVVEGLVRVVLDPRGVRLAPGEILVCPGTDPGWTPLFLTAGGLIMEMGGMITHGAMVAREYGLPAVVGVRQATSVLRTGQRVRLDGSAGRVTILD
jgi:pyruvate,water dikinase